MSNPSYSIRCLTAEDVRSYRDIRLESLQTAPDAYASSYEEESVQNDTFFIGRIEDGGTFGCFSNDVLIGVSGYFVNKHIKCAHVAAIWGVYLKPEYRGQGLATHLLERVIASLPDSIEQVRLSAGRHNDAARALYRKAGFVEYGLKERVLKIDAQYYDNILMVKFL